MWAEIFTAFGAEVEKQTTGCCGMAGMYGHEAEHKASSMKLYRMSWEEKVQQGGNLAVTGFSCRCQVKRAEGTVPAHPVELLLTLLQND
jgi:Fe-S oxidoreductase